MYTLKESWMRMYGADPVDNWDGKMYCAKTDAAMVLRTNETHGFLAAYTFTLVTEGCLTMVYNGQELTLRPDDLYIYSPGLPVTIAGVSDDYRAICLLADEHVAAESPTVHDLVHMAYLPIVRLHEPKLSLPHDDALALLEKMEEISNYLHSDHIYKDKVVRMLYAIFLLDVQNVQNRAVAHCHISRRVEEIFIGFIRLLPHHFVEHHDIGFYASRLNISTVYLSRIVRQVTGRTVMDYINQSLTMEAAFLLHNSTLSIAQIADRLHFADLPSFSRFFSRMKGLSPREYREKRQ